MLTICTWIWGNKYSPVYLHKLRAMLARNLKQKYRFIYISPEARQKIYGIEFFEFNKDIDLFKIQGCFGRLRMFDPAFQAAIGLEDRLVCLDLDLVVTGSLDFVFDRSEDFVILQGANASNPCPFNGSVMMLRKGKNEEVWTDFSLKKAFQTPFFEFPDDQGWLHYKIPNAAGWECGAASGVWSFAKRQWPKDNNLPSEAKIVAFPGHRDPSQFMHLDWVKEHWRA